MQNECVPFSMHDTHRSTITLRPNKMTRVTAIGLQTMGRQSICSHVTSAQATLTSSLHDTNFCHTPPESASNRNVHTSLLPGRPQGWRSQIRLHKMNEKRAALAEGYSRDHLWWIRLRRMTRISAFSADYQRAVNTYGGYAFAG
jgi:hypothetical protein